MATLCANASGDESESSDSRSITEDDYEDGNSIAVDVECQLEDFRKQWHAEIHDRTGGHRMRRLSGGENKQKLPETKPKAAPAEKKSAPIRETRDELTAQELWLRGEEAERSHDLMRAVQCYRKALQLVPDIEKRMNILQKQSAAAELPKPKSNEPAAVDSPKGGREVYDSDMHCEKVDDDSSLPLITRIRRALDEQVMDGEPLIQQGEQPLDLERELDQEDATALETEEPNGTDSPSGSSNVHFGQLPIELLLTVLSYVVGPDLDARSLEQCASVCRGFYLLSRDEDIWRLICARAYGASNAVRYLLNLEMSCWRELYIQVPHLYFNGVYLSRTSYVRSGEPGFNRTYAPFYLVEYYRCIRFLPDGLVVMVTSAEEPAALVRLLRSSNLATLCTNRPANANVVYGKYRVAYDEFDFHPCDSLSDKVKIYMHLSRASSTPAVAPAPATSTSRHFGSNLSNASKTTQLSGKPSSSQCDPPTSFCIEMTLGGKHHRRLKWQRYSMMHHVSWGSPVASEFRITDEQYPSFFFSRVKSFTAESLGCLK